LVHSFFDIFEQDYIPAIIPFEVDLMTDEALFQELQRLKKEIHFHNYRYHVLDDPILSDYEYDQMIKRLHSIEENTPNGSRWIPHPAGQAINLWINLSR
jgi:hypothetical protein